MAAGLTSSLRILLLAIGALVVIAACTSLQRPTVQADTVALPTPLRSYDAAVATTIGQLQDAAARSGNRLMTANRPYRPSEPPSLLQAPRVVMRADLADPEDGYVVIYDADDADTAARYAADLADYLESGFGQSNFAADTQFSVAVAGDAVVFTSLSRSRSSDPERAAEIYEALASVGQRVEVLK